MSRDEIISRFSELENLEALAAELETLEEDEEILELLQRYGLELSEKDVMALTEGDELAEDDLSDVVGGCKCKGFLKRVVSKIVGFVSKKIFKMDWTCPDCED